METQIYHPTCAHTNLVVLERGTISYYDLESKPRWLMGRATSSNIPDIPLSSPIASRIHGEFVMIDNQWFYFDLKSRNGTLHNGTKIRSGMNGRIRPIMLENGDILQIDRSKTDRTDPRGIWMLFSTESISGEWRYYSLVGKSSVSIGRDKTRCDLAQPLGYVSALHAKITQHEGVYYVSDCGSRAGTWLNNMQIHNPTRLRDKDKISICDCHFIFTGLGLIYNDRQENHKMNSDKPVILKANIHSKKVPNQSGHGEKVLIRDVKLEIRSGELVALLGGSGAGKTTLMNCLNGTEQSGVDGTVLLYGEDLYKHYERLKYLVGNVPQKNIFHESLPVEEELRNAAVLRLPGDATKAYVEEQVDKALQALSLEAKRKTQIRKLSGGEQKRVNIGIELVADRQLLYLDEPDAGLDPLAKKELFLTLQNYAHRLGKSIIVIIHDVSQINLFDQIIMMAKVDDVGRLAFAGTPEEGCQYFHVDDLAKAYSAIKEDPERYIMVNG